MSIFGQLNPKPYSLEKEPINFLNFQNSLMNEQNKEKSIKKPIKNELESQNFPDNLKNINGNSIPLLDKKLFEATENNLFKNVSPNDVNCFKCKKILKSCNKLINPHIQTLKDGYIYPVIETNGSEIYYISQNNQKYHNDLDKILISCKNCWKNEILNLDFIQDALHPKFPYFDLLKFDYFNNYSKIYNESNNNIKTFLGSNKFGLNNIYEKLLINCNENLAVNQKFLIKEIINLSEQQLNKEIQDLKILINTKNDIFEIMKKNLVDDSKINDYLSPLKSDICIKENNIQEWKQFLEQILMIVSN